MSMDFGKSACIHTNTIVNTALITLSPLTAAEKHCLFLRNNIPSSLCCNGERSLVTCRFPTGGSQKA